MQWGASLSALEDRALKGHRIGALDGRPEVEDHNLFYWNAFSLLTGSRDAGFSLGCIPLSEIEAFCRLARIEDVEERMEFVHIIQAMDREFVEFHRKKGGTKNARA